MFVKHFEMRTLVSGAGTWPPGMALDVCTIGLGDFAGHTVLQVLSPGCFRARDGGRNASAYKQTSSSIQEGLL
jgi:hypothetical protein